MFHLDYSLCLVCQCYHALEVHFLDSKTKTVRVLMLHKSLCHFPHTRVALSLPLLWPPSIMSEVARLSDKFFLLPYVAIF